MRALRLPWNSRDVPHAALDILRGCDISCRACFNTRPRRMKTLKEIEADLDLLLSKRRVETLTIIGGEATLHPDLCEVIRMARRRGLTPMLLTNGFRIGRDKELPRQLKAAGLAMVAVHVDDGQRRPDLPPTPGSEDLKKLRDHLAECIGAAGMRVGLEITSYRSKMTELMEAIQHVIDSPETDYLLVTQYTDLAVFKRLEGDVEKGLRCVEADHERKPDLPNETLSIAETEEAIRARFGWRPFAYVSSNLDRSEQRWISYSVGVSTGRDGRRHVHALNSSLFERVAIRLIRLLSGRYVFSHKDIPWVFRGQLLLNAISGGNIMGNLRFLAQSMRPGSRLRMKHVIIQDGPSLRPTGELVYCNGCPDATIFDGRLVPQCLSDRIAAAAQGCT